MDLKNKYLNIRQHSVGLCKPLETEDYITQAAEFASPPKWNLGHTTWFFEQFILQKYQSGYKPFHHKYSFIFNSYYENVGERVKRPNRGTLSRPTVNKVLNYREYVDRHMVLFLEKPVTAQIHDLVLLGLNHEQQHQELLLTDLKYNFSVNPLYPTYSEKAFCEDISIEEKTYLSIDEGIYTIGYEGDGFHFDNEKEAHLVFIHPFQIRESLVSNAEYLEFIEDGGYRNVNLWHSEAWQWLTENNISKPMYWKKIKNEWYQYTLAGLRKINYNHPVTHINYYEAYAFAQWHGKRLPTEFEWEAASDQFKWGNRWEWTESAYLPYPGYKKARGAVGEYNGKFMVNQKVLRGASVITPPLHSRKTYRNFFPPNLGYQFTGIRLAI